RCIGSSLSDGWETNLSPQLHAASYLQLNGSASDVKRYLFVMNVSSIQLNFRVTEISKNEK
uniref:Ovule protein n=1 Tax=Parascaris univalens TaxID=6257 RepID=A0A915BLR3_PARUN